MRRDERKRPMVVRLGRTGRRLMSGTGRGVAELVPEALRVLSEEMAGVEGATELTPGEERLRKQRLAAAKAVFMEARMIARMLGGGAERAGRRDGDSSEAEEEDALRGLLEGFGGGEEEREEGAAG